jgi:acetyltransferase-like isoleucine patch superfamily enzyme
MAIEVPSNPWDIEIADGVALAEGVIMLSTGPRTQIPRIKIGEHVYVNRHTMFDASCSIRVGANVMIGPFCYITDHDHEADGEALLRTQGFVEEPVSIGPNVWLGAGVIVLKGVSIGEGAVVGAGSVVTKSVPSGARVAGNPARVLASASDPAS